jgi:hypothetical protein
MSHPAENPANVRAFVLLKEGNMVVRLPELISCVLTRRIVAFLLCLLAPSIGCSRREPSTPTPARSPTVTPGKGVDADGVQELLPSAPGSSFRLGASDPNQTPDFGIEKNGRATRHTEGALTYWTISAYPLDYSSGGSGKTCRLHIHASGGDQEFTWQTQHGYLSSPRDLKNQEFTAYVRVHGIFDVRRAMVTLKIRGGKHTQDDGDLASCTMMTFSPAASPAVTRFGKELVHPEYDYVKLVPSFPASLEENRWVGLKLVSYAPTDDPGRVINRLYVDDAPFDEAGRPANHFRLFSEFIDVEGHSTGRYTKLVDWGGWETTVRADGITELDFAIVSAREITPPAH